MVAASRSTWPTSAPAVEEEEEGTLAEEEEDTAEEEATRVAEATKEEGATKEEEDTAAGTSRVRFTCHFHRLECITNMIIFSGGYGGAQQGGGWGMCLRLLQLTHH